MRMNEIVFEVTADNEVGGWVAAWDDANGGGISTQGDSLAELEFMIRDAISVYFADRLPSERPRRVQLHFLDDPRLTVA